MTDPTEALRQVLSDDLMLKLVYGNFWCSHADGTELARNLIIAALTQWVQEREQQALERLMLAAAEITQLRRECAEVARLKAEKHGAYAERNRLVAALSKLWPSHMALHPADDASWDDEWRQIVCIHSPFGQLSWHIKDGEEVQFTHLSVATNDWDGHTTDEKYARLARLAPAQPTPKET